jgi:asparagine synthase (glutamine-hydrolysing)
MCGVAGFWSPGGLAADAAGILARMTGCIAHRGPDDAGTWIDAGAGIALGHRRLSVLDLSAEGHQPMASRDGRYVMVYNGEIYNFAVLRTELEALGYRFRGHSDTEVMLAAFEQWGLAEAVGRLAGMFALALWDRRDHQLHLARDRFGEKPLYYGWQHGTLLFGSELKSLRTHPSFHASVDRDALTLYFRHNYVPAPRSIYEGIAKVDAASIVTIDRAGATRSVRYWKLEDAIVRGRAAPVEGSDEELTSLVESRLRATIREEMIADVPLGAFLSGGIDSSTIVALMQAESRRPVKTFTIGFGEDAYNEAVHAQAVARHLGTDHTELYVTAEQAREVIPRLPALYDEPFGDSSQIPTFLVAQMARQHVTVALSGDGGDEAFGGYNRYFIGRRIWRTLAPVPVSVRRGVARAIHGVSPASWGAVLGAAQSVLPSRARVAHAGDRMHKLADVFASRSMGDMYRSLVSHWHDPAAMVLGGREPATLLDEPVPGLEGLSDVERMMYWDARTYLPDDIMVKVDRAAMAVSLEVRAPFLDHRVMELAWQLPIRMKLRDDVGKWVVRKVLERHVPNALVERPKMGFGVPIDQWLRGPLREWAGDLLSPDRLRREGYLRPEVVQVKWEEHQAGTRNWQYLLWDVLMFQAWRAQQ